MRLLLFVTLLALSLNDSTAAEEGHLELGAHAHGHGTFNIVLDGRTLAMELQAPGVDIVGFEHAAQTDAQKAAIAKARKLLGGPINVVTLPASAGCRLVSVNVELHGGHEENSVHSEFHAEYQLTCAALDKLTEITFPYFQQFKQAEELDVTIIGSHRQQKLEVNRDNTTINLEGFR